MSPCSLQSQPVIACVLQAPGGWQPGTCKQAAPTMLAAGCLQLTPLLLRARAIGSCKIRGCLQHATARQGQGLGVSKRAGVTSMCGRQQRPTSGWQANGQRTPARCSTRHSPPLHTARQCPAAPAGPAPSARSAEHRGAWCTQPLSAMRAASQQGAPRSRAQNASVPPCKLPCTIA